MDDRHVKKELLARFLRAEATKEEARRVVRHLRLIFRNSLARHQMDSLFHRMREYFRRHWVQPAMLE